MQGSSKTFGVIDQKLRTDLIIGLAYTTEINDQYEVTIWIMVILWKSKIGMIQS